MRYDVVCLRQSLGGNHLEASFDSEDDAVIHVVSLSVDADCLLGEVQVWSPASSGFDKRSILAQYERIGNNWRSVTGDLRCRTEAGEAAEILRQFRNKE